IVAVSGLLFLGKLCSKIKKKREEFKDEHNKRIFAKTKMGDSAVANSEPAPHRCRYLKKTKKQTDPWINPKVAITIQF
ncbi:hypothetical protein, partial [Chryseobacterium sp. P1-3]|uniref:hypothetical protein n=1 Tax=Chryseobacterium sp. (strain P1-3) TaxID=1517683 RepID=UPI000678F516